MCGILCVASNACGEKFEQALNSLSHRGPDGRMAWHSEEYQVSLGHQRLAILDRSEAGAQPMEAHGYVITFNGEIFNFVELRHELEQKGYSFRTQTDTEVLAAALREWGSAALLKLNGMWAFAALDLRNRTIFVARDRFGIKPLFYSRTPLGWAFASEMKGLFPFLPRVEKSADFEWCAQHLYEYEATDKCLIQGIHRFPAGHYAVIQNGEVKLTRYWNTFDHLPSQIPATYDEQVERFRELFLESCKIRMRSDVKIGTSLSGGVDSTAVVCAIAHIGKNWPYESRLCKDWQNAFSAGFPNTEFDESVYAQKTAEYLGIALKIFEIQAPSLESVIDEQWFFEELYPTPSTPMMAVYKQMRENGIVVSMDGHGADELLGGYHNVLLAAWTDANFNLKKIKQIHEVYRENFFFNRDKSFDFRDYLAHIWKRKRVLVAKHISRSFAEKYLGLEKERRLGEFNFELYRLFTATVMPTLLRNYDRYSMAHGVEVRMPFMDWRLVSYAMALPWTAKIRNGYTKAVLRDAVAPFSPHEVIYRKSKIGYTAPVHAWMNGPWREPLMDLMHSSEFVSCPIMPDAPAVVRRFLPTLASSQLSMLDAFKLWERMLPYFWYKSILAGDKVKLHAA